MVKKYTTDGKLSIDQECKNVVTKPVGWIYQQEPQKAYIRRFNSKIYAKSRQKS